ncbi:MAG: bacillithiol biosynthesis deacetylase BshB1, partial [Balneolales bacterium]|nr:bacillithiol biosynthesis deacetylase BshB1 [Balneolales bacterium]
EQQPWRPHHIMHYMQDRTFTPSIVFDITDTIDIKEKAILAFGSQFNVANPGEEPETYISGTGFFANLRARSQFYGHQIGVTYGEPFLYHGGPLPMKDLGILMNNKRKR